MKKIVIQIDKNGNSEIVTTGFTGSECRDATADLEAKLGKCLSDSSTPEFYSQEIKTEVCNDF